MEKLIKRFRDAVLEVWESLKAVAQKVLDWIRKNKKVLMFWHAGQTGKDVKELSKFYKILERTRSRRIHKKTVKRIHNLVFLD